MSSSKIWSEDPGIPKWKIALAVGGAVALGAGLYYKLNRKQIVTAGDTNKDSMKNSSTKSSSCKTQPSNGAASPATDDTPLGKARQHKTEGNSLFRNEKYDEAIQCYDKAIEACPKTNPSDLSTFFQNRAAAYEHKKEWPSVLRDCSSALELHPRYTKALVRRARAAEVLQDLDLALEDYTAICIIETFSNQDSLQVVDRLLKQIGLAHAMELFGCGEGRQRLPSVHAIKAYMSGFCCDPVYNSVHSEKEGDGDEAEDMPEKHAVPDGYLRARQHLRDDSYEEIRLCCVNELANPLSPYTAHALLLRGTIHVLYNDRNLAVRDFSTLADMEDAPVKFRVSGLVKLGALEMAYNNSDEALVHYNRAMSLDDSCPDVYHQRGQMNLMMNKIEEAIKDFDKVADLNPKFAIGYIQKLHTDYRYATFKGDKATAAKVLRQFEEARTKFPKCTEVYLLMAQILVDEEQYDKADSLFSELLSVEPNNPVAQVYRGMLQVQWKGDIPAAIKLIKEALEMDDQCEMALENLATICVQTGNLEEGVRLFNRAIPLAKSITEMSHFCSLRDAAVAQIKVVKRLGISLPDATNI